MSIFLVSITYHNLIFLGSVIGQSNNNNSLLLEPEEIIDFATGIFAIFLMTLSIISYRNLKARRLIFVSAAFGLYALRTMIARLVDLTIPESQSIAIEMGLAIAGFAILAFFFIAIVKKEKVTK
jgi:predicted PurR-regulated permease PerM